MKYDEYEHLIFERRSGGVLLITINRPDVLNAADRTLHRELAEVWRTFDADEHAHVAVITGAGSAFSAGGDLAMVEQMTTDVELLREQMEHARTTVRAMVELEKPVISAINGVAIGAGLAVALLADISIMADTARFTDGHLRIGVAAGDHAALIWPLLCSMAKAKYYVFTSEFIDGKEAERIGLVSKCVPTDEVLSTALEIADRLAAASPTALRWTKRSFNEWLRLGLPAFEQSLGLEMLSFQTPEAAEALGAMRGRT